MKNTFFEESYERNINEREDIWIVSQEENIRNIPRRMKGNKRKEEKNPTLLDSGNNLPIDMQNVLSFARYTI